MAQFELSAQDRDRLASALIAIQQNLETAAAEPQGLNGSGVGVADIDRTQKTYKALLDRLQSVRFNLRDCLKCGKQFEAANPRKVTCSDACRQALSRSKRRATTSTPRAAAPKAKVKSRSDRDKQKGTFDFAGFTTDFPTRNEPWGIAEQDAKSLPKGITTQMVWTFKIKHKIDIKQHLSIEAKKALVDEFEKVQRGEKGRAAFLAQALVKLKERATPELLWQIAVTIWDGDPLCTGHGLDDSRSFLLNSLEIVGIKKREKLVKGVWTDLEKLIPHAAEITARAWDVDPEDPFEPDRVKSYRCLYWGAALHLASTPGDPPKEFPELLDWCGFSAHKAEAARRFRDNWWALGDRMAGKPTNASDRELLGLPTNGSITREGIRKAHREAAKDVHPDQGGSHEAMSKLNQAKERLLVTVAA